MDESSFKKLSIQKLGEYLQNNGVSMEAVTCLEVNKVTGLALLLVDETELKELLQTILDRAVVWNLLKNIGKIYVYYIVYNCLYIYYVLQVNFIYKSRKI